MLIDANGVRAEVNVYFAAPSFIGKHDGSRRQEPVNSTRRRPFPVAKEIAVIILLRAVCDFVTSQGIACHLLRVCFSRGAWRTEGRKEGETRKRKYEVRGLNWNLKQRNASSRNSFISYF